jgi:hypothetical protein
MAIEPVVRKFSSFEEADKADREYNRSLTPQQRLEITIHLMDEYRRLHGYSDRLERVYRIVKLSES